MTTPVSKHRRIVRLSARTAAKQWAKLWGYSYDDLAALFGITETSVRAAVRRNKLDPADLSSIIGFYLSGLKNVELTELLAQLQRREQ